MSEIVADNDTAAQLTPDEIVWEGFPLPRLSEYGKIVDKWIKNISVKYPEISVERYVIMPNHVHLLLFLTNDGRGDPGRGDPGRGDPGRGDLGRGDLGRGAPSPTTTTAVTINEVMGWFKYQSTKEINATRGTLGQKIWQRSFYDHIIRNQHDYDEIVKYIYENPIKWRFDKLFEEQ